MSGGFGLGPDALSGFLEHEWSKTIPTVDDSMATGIQMFPRGNSDMIRLLIKTLIPEAIEGPRTMEAVWMNSVNFAPLDHACKLVRMRLDSTAVVIKHLVEPAK